MSITRLLCPLVFLLPVSLNAGRQNGSQAPAVAAPSPIQLRIAAANKKVKAAPNVQSYNDLAFAFLRQGRDTADIRAYDEAASAINRSLELQPGNYEARKLQAALYLQTGQYAKALKTAAELNHKVPDDIVNWGLLSDANMALGNYAEAEKDAQWILDLRAGSALGFEKAAGLREVFGDFTGSIEFYDEANLRTSPNDADQRAWYLTRKAELELAAGSTSLAQEVIEQALLLVPDSQLALGTLASIRAAQCRYDEAAALLERKYKQVNNAKNLYALAEALEKSSHPAGAAVLFEQFEGKAKSGNVDNDLIFFYLNHKKDPVKALSLAVSRSAEYQDCGTLDALAWALYSNGKFSEAKTQMDRALAVGVRNSSYFGHAAQIAAKLNDTAASQKYRKELADLSPTACPAERNMDAMSERKR